MKKASVEIDGIVAVAIFLLFIAWSFTYYSNIGSGSDTAVISESVNAKIIGYLKPEGYRVLLKYPASSPKSGAVLYFDYMWEFGKETTMVYKGSSQLPCQISGNTVYFQADLTAGNNYFLMTYSNETGTGCSSTISLADIDRTSVLLKEKESIVSEKKINEMKAMGYEEFKKHIGANNDFRVELSRGGSTETLGKALPKGSIYSAKTISRVRETGQDIEIRTFIWQ